MAMIYIILWQIKRRYYYLEGIMPKIILFMLTNVLHMLKVFSNSVTWVTHGNILWCLYVQWLVILHFTKFLTKWEVLRKIPEYTHWFKSDPQQEFGQCGVHNMVKLPSLSDLHTVNMMHGQKFYSEK